MFFGFRPLPEHFREGMSVPFQLTFWDQAYEEISVQGPLFVEGRRKRNTAGERRISSLFEPCGKSPWTEPLDPDSVEQCAGKQGDKVEADCHQGQQQEGFASAQQLMKQDNQRRETAP